MGAKRRDPWWYFGGGFLLIVALGDQLLACEASAQHRPASPVVVSPTESMSPAATQQPVAEAPPTNNPCSAPESEEALMTCEHREFERAEEAIRRREAALREVYGREPALLEALATAQGKWREFRDAECGLDTYDSRGGTAFESFWVRCQRELDWQRASRLQLLIDHP